MRGRAERGDEEGIGLARGRIGSAVFGTMYRAQDRALPKYASPETANRAPYARSPRMGS